MWSVLLPPRAWQLHSVMCWLGYISLMCRNTSFASLPNPDISSLKATDTFIPLLEERVSKAVLSFCGEVEATTDFFLLITSTTKKLSLFWCPSPKPFPCDHWTSEVPSHSSLLRHLCCNPLITNFLNTPWHSDAFPDVNVDSNQFKIQPLPWQLISLWIKHGDRYLDFWSAVGMLMTFMWGTNCECDRTHYL